MFNFKVTFYKHEFLSFFLFFNLNPAFQRLYPQKTAAMPGSHDHRQATATSGRHKLPITQLPSFHWGWESITIYHHSYPNSFIENICFSPCQFPEKTRDIRELCERYTVFLLHRLARYISIKEPALPCMCKPRFFTWPAWPWRVWEGTIPALESRCHEGQCLLSGSQFTSSGRHRFSIK